nr:serine/threonine-protein phosphatase 7 isoform X1 [Ipomoea batatas]
MRSCGISLSKKDKSLGENWGFCGSSSSSESEEEGGFNMWDTAWVVVEFQLDVESQAGAYFLQGLFKAIKAYILLGKDEIIVKNDRAVILGDLQTNEKRQFLILTSKSRKNVDESNRERSGEAKPNLDIKLDEISQVISRGIEREDGVLLEGIHSPIRRLQYIHSVPSVSDHHKFRWPQTAASPHFHPCRNHQFNPSPFTHESESKQRSQKRTHSPWGKRVEQREAFSGTCPPTLGMPMPAIWAALRAIIYCSNCRRRNDRTQREEKGLRTKEHRTWECRLNTRWKTVNGHFDGIFSPVTRIHVVDRIGKEVGHDDVEMRRRKSNPVLESFANAKTIRNNNSRSHEGPDAREKRPGLGGMDAGYTIDHLVESGKFKAPHYPQF